MAKRINSANLIVRESIETALIELLNKKPIEKITITEIVNKAGVGRISFYRNYYYKEDVLFSAMDRIAAEWKTNAENSQTDLIDQILKLFELEKPLLSVIYKNDLSRLMYKLIQKYCGLEDSSESLYIKSSVAGAIFGLCDEWVRRGMKETPEEIKAMFEQLKNNKKSS